MANLGLVIKNAFLMVLIIWILHFLLKNVLMGQKQPDAEKASETLEIASPLPRASMEADEDAEAKAKPDAPIPAPLSTDDRTSDDLYDFIFRSDSSSASVSAPAKAKPQDHEPDSADPTLALSKRSNRHWVKEYQGEKLLNGGELCQGLNPYDQDFSPYDTLTPTA